MENSGMIDSEELLVKAGYLTKEEFPLVMNRIRNYAKVNKVPSEILEIVLVDFFIEISEDPQKYMKPVIERTEFDPEQDKDIVIKYRECVCGCTISNPSTNLTHSIFKELDKERADFLKDQAKAFSKRINSRVQKHVKKQALPNYYLEVNVFIVIIIVMALIRFMYGS